jgi:hypothetical protein
MAPSLLTVSNYRRGSDVSVIVSAEERTLPPFDVGEAITSQIFSDLCTVIGDLLTAYNNRLSAAHKRSLGWEFKHCAEEVQARTAIAADVQETLEERGDCFQELRSYVGDLKDHMQALLASNKWPHELPSGLRAIMMFSRFHKWRVSLPGDRIVETIELVTKTQPTPRVRVVARSRKYWIPVKDDSSSDSSNASSAYDAVQEHVLNLGAADNTPCELLSAEEGVEVSLSVKKTLLEQLSARKSEFESLNRALETLQDPSLPWVKKTIEVRAVMMSALCCRAHPASYLQGT